MTTHDERVAAVWSALAALVLEDDRRRRVSEELGISFYRAKILRRLLDGPSSMRDLAVRLGTDKANLSGAVDDLEQLGLLERSIDSADRRVRRLTLTPQGTKAARRANQILAQPPRGFESLGDDDLTALERIITRVRSCAS